MEQPIPNCLKSSLEQDERPVAQRGLHWVFMMNGLFWFLALAGMGWAADIALWAYFGAFIPRYEFYNSYFQFGLQPGWIGGFFSVCGGAILFIQFLQYATTFIAVTNKRIIKKRGWINIRLDQTDLSDVRGVHVDQGWFGQFLGYGKIMLDCRFVNDVNIPFVSAPFQIVSAIQKMKSDIEAHLSGAGTRQDVAGGQTIIQINPSPDGGRTIIQHSGGEQIVVQTVHDLPSVQKKLASDILHDEILDDFKKTH